MDATLDEADRWALTQQVAVGSDGDAALVNLTTEDTLYRVTKQGMAPEAILHKGKYRRPEKPIIQIVSPDSPTYLISTDVTSFGDYYFIRHLGLGLVLEIWNRSKGELLAYSNGRRVGSDQAGFRFGFLSGETASVANYYIDGDTMAFVVNALDIAIDIDGVKEDDNPVIVVTKLKR